MLVQAWRVCESRPVSPGTRVDAHLVDEALRRAPVVWIAHADGTRPRAVWCAYASPLLYVVSGGSEQPTPPALADAASVQLIVRSKDDRHRLVELTADVTVVGRGDDDHETAWRQVDAARLHRHLEPDATGLVLHRLAPHAP